MAHNLTRLNVTFFVTWGSMQLDIGEEKDMNISTEDPLRLAASYAVSDSKIAFLVYSYLYAITKTVP